MRSRTGLIVAALAAAAVSLAPPAEAIGMRNIVLKANKNDYPILNDWGYSACWGYVHPDGREYAVLGTHNGTAIYNVTDTDNVYLVGFIPGLASSWREMKSYRTWIYVVTENATAAGGIQPGIQIIRMIDPENPLLVGTYNLTFNRSHTISVDTTRAILICNGTNLFTPPSTTTRKGMRILSLASPEAPVEIAAWPPLAADQLNIANYVHDCVPIGNDRLYASSIYVGVQRILDFTNPAAPFEIKNWTYPGAYYCHSAWPDPIRSRLYICDEQNGQTLRVFDISNETSPVLANEWTSNPSSIVHNPRVLANELWLANYTEGIRALDITDPTSPAEWAYADSWPGTSGGFNGVWEVYPYFPSGTVIASDMSTGLYVYRATRDYGVAYVTVTDGQDPLAGAKVFVEETGDSAQTSGAAAVAFAPNPGLYTITARKFGYESASTQVALGQGDHTPLELALTLKPTSPYAGTVVDANTASPLEGAEVNLRWTPVHDHTDAAGAFDLGAVPHDTYRVDIRRPGYIPASFERVVGLPPTSQTFALQPAALYDPLTVDNGWTVGGAGTGDNATQGVWVRVEPLGTSIGGTQPELAVMDIEDDPGSTASPLGSLGAPKPRAGPLHGDHEGEGANPGQVQPEVDRTPPPGELCWVTGQGASATAIDEADVDGPSSIVGGKTTLTSPAYDLTGMSEPTISCWLWFYTQFGSEDDWFAILISNDNGVNWTPVDTLRGLHNHWEEAAIRVEDYLAPSSQVKVRFVAADYGIGSVVEAGVDDIAVYDATAGAISVFSSQVAPPRLAIQPPRPNPARTIVALTLEVPRPRPIAVGVYDLAGRRVATLFHGRSAPGPLQLRWDGMDSNGRSVPSGVYIVQARMEGEAVDSKARTSGEVTEVRIAWVR